MDDDKPTPSTGADLAAGAELGRELADDGLDGLDHLLGLAPGDEPLAAREIAALVRLIRNACARKSNGAID